RILIDGAAERLLLDREKAHALGHRGEGGCKARRACTDDQQIEPLAVSGTRAVDRFHGLPALLQGVADEAHTAQLAGDEDSRHARLELRAQNRNFHAAPLAAEHERNCIHGAYVLARAVTDATDRKS